MIDILLIANAPSWEGMETWANAAGVPMELIYLDPKGKTGDLFGVRRLPETLIYDPAGLLAHQARGPMSWSGARLTAQIEQIKSGVEEIH